MPEYAQGRYRQCAMGYRVQERERQRSYAKGSRREPLAARPARERQRSAHSRAALVVGSVKLVCLTGKEDRERERMGCLVSYEGGSAPPLPSSGRGTRLSMRVKGRRRKGWGQRQRQREVERE